MVFLVALGLLTAALFLIVAGVVYALARLGLVDLSEYPPPSVCSCDACRDARRRQVGRVWQ